MKEQWPPWYNRPMPTNNVIGYRVVNIDSGRYVNHDGNGYHWLSSEDSVPPEPISRGDAFRRLAAFLDSRPEERHDDYRVEEVYHTPTPMERATSDLAAQLRTLVSRHGLQLNLSQEQIEAKLARELADYGITDPAGVSAFLGR